MTIADLTLIEKLLKENTGYKISQGTGIGEMTISKWRSGKVEIKKMSLENAIKLTEYALKLKEEMEKMKKLYLNEVLPNGLGFDVSELSDAWEQDENGYYTCDEEEYQWFEKLSRAYDLKEEYGVEVDDRYINDWDDYIRQIEEKVAEIEGN